MRYISPPEETPLGWTKVEVANHKYAFSKVINGITCRLIFSFIDSDSGCYQVFVDFGRPKIFYSLDKANTFCEVEAAKIDKTVDCSFKFVETVTIKVFEFNGKDYNLIGDDWYYVSWGGARLPIEDSKLEDSLYRLYKAWIETNV